jgi:hypothetical protein
MKIRSTIILMALALALVLCVSASAETYIGYTQEEFDALEATTVIASPDSPTGYYVTFRYKDAEAERVRLYGEWAFSDMAHANLVSTLGATPEEWQDGYILHSIAGWPVVDLTLNEATGVWSYTIPLPNGTYSYRFILGGGETGPYGIIQGAVSAYDPNNVPLLNGGIADSGEEFLSAIYVPYDAEKQSLTASITGKRELEAPRDGENGEVIFGNIPDSEGINVPFGIYLPYGFDADRSEAYPILTLYHGAGGTESSWINGGAIYHILDNVIAEGSLEPTIVVIPTTPPEGWDRAKILDNVVNVILPYMSENYNASTEPARRAFAGLSMGGATTGYAMFHYTDDFDYYGIFSAPMLEDVAPDYTLPQLKEKKIFIGFGSYDFVAFRSLYSIFPDADGNKVQLTGGGAEGSSYEYMVGLSRNGVSYYTLEIPANHLWTLWRKCAADFFVNLLWK